MRSARATRACGAARPARGRRLRGVTATESRPTSSLPPPLACIGLTRRAARSIPIRLALGGADPIGAASRRVCLPVPRRGGRLRPGCEDRGREERGLDRDGGRPPRRRVDRALEPVQRRPGPNPNPKDPPNPTLIGVPGCLLRPHAIRRPNTGPNRIPHRPGPNPIPKIHPIPTPAINPIPRLNAFLHHLVEVRLPPKRAANPAKNGRRPGKNSPAPNPGSILPNGELPTLGVGTRLGGPDAGRHVHATSVGPPAS